MIGAMREIKEQVTRKATLDGTVRRGVSVEVTFELSPE